MTETIQADLSANVWKILVAVGDPVVPDEPLMILESMKMEIPVIYSDAGTVVAMHVKEGANVGVGQPLIEISAQ
ncbi:acetyl-CoA carboxylase biotin carboxyl carrier protein subunit [Rhodococcus sp. WS4]|nr:acetyl-CoA carboxylase biotin carboxyl carrier protein subunit [Rhodococcus sp. WS4]